MSDRQPSSMGALRARNSLLKDEHDDIEYAQGELYYVDLGSVDRFRELCERHGLKLTAEFPHMHWQWAWVAPDGLKLRTHRAPFDGDREGYLSYTFVRGPAGAAERFYRDIVDSAERIKGEFDELTTDAGEPIVSYWDIQEESGSDEQQSVDSDEQQSSDSAPDRRSAFWNELWDDSQESNQQFEIVAKTDDDEWVPLEQFGVDSPKELADDVLWRYQEVSS